MQRLMTRFLMLIMVVSVPFVDVHVISAQTVSTYVNNLLAPDGLSLDAEGNLYASHYAQTFTVYKITPDGEVSSFLTEQPGPAGSAFDDTGNMYISMYYGNSVVKATPDGEFENFATGSSISGPVDVGFDAVGRLYVVNDSDPKYIIRVEADGSNPTPLFINPGTGWPSAIAFDNQGYYYLTVYNNSTIYRVNVETNETSFYAMGPSGGGPGMGFGFIRYSELTDTLYMTGLERHQIFMCEREVGEVEVLTGTNEAGHVDGDLEMAQFNKPVGLAVTTECIDNYENEVLFVAEADGQKIRKITLPTGIDCVPNGIEDVGVESFDSFQLDRNYPNPMSSRTQIAYQLTSSSDAQLSIFDIAGRLVKTLASGTQASGHYSVQWDGTDQDNTAVDSGVYFYQLQLDGAQETKRLVLVR